MAVYELCQHVPMLNIDNKKKIKRTEDNSSIYRIQYEVQYTERNRKV